MSDSVEQAYRLGYSLTCAAHGVTPDSVAGARMEMSKRANDLGILASRVVDYLGPMVLGVPVLAGAGAGALIGKLSQNTSADVSEREKILEQDALEKATQDVTMRTARRRERQRQLAEAEAREAAE